MTDQAIEQEIVAKGKTAPRIAAVDIDANISGEYYFTAIDGIRGVKWMTEINVDTSDISDINSLGSLTFCVLVLRNGFTVTGESACASPENFDAEIGRKIARQNAVAKIWPLMGYELSSRIAERVPSRLNVVVETPVLLDDNCRIAPHEQRVIDEKAELDAKLEKLVPFLSSDTCHGLPFDERSRLKRQAEIMADYSAILGARIAEFGGAA